MYSKLKIEIISGLYNDLLNHLIEKGFLISSIKSTQFGVQFICRPQDYFEIAKTAKKYQCRTRIIQRKGIYFLLKKTVSRKSITVSAVSVLIYIFLFSKLIWRIDVISPDSQINNAVYNLLHNNDVYAGAVFSQEKNQNIIQQIFMDVEDVGYVTMNFYKGVLTCKVDPVTERKQYLENLASGNITASQNGVIEDLRIYSGFSDIKTGQTVTKGQILVSSTYIDRNGKLHSVKPRAYIKAACVKKYTAQVDMDKTVWIRNGEKAEKTVLKTMGINIPLKNENIRDFFVYDTEKSFRYINFLGFNLPFTVEKTEYYKKEQADLKKDEQTALAAAKDIVHTLIKNDISLEKVESKNYEYSVSGDVLTLVCTVQGYYDIAK